jgi:hypothetical protein
MGICDSQNSPLILIICQQNSASNSLKNASKPPKSINLKAVGDPTAEIYNHFWAIFQELKN